jgi:TonB family protein
LREFAPPRQLNRWAATSLIILLINKSNDIATAFLISATFIMRRRATMMRALFAATLICIAFLSVQPRVNGQGNGTKANKTVVSGGVLNGKAISKPQPPYPPIAKTAKASGTVTVQVLVNEEGKVVSAKAVSGHKLLRKAAVDAAYQAKFSPRVVSGQRVKVSGVLTYEFVYKE